MSNKHFLAAMYLRLSRDDSDVEDVMDGERNLKSEIAAGYTSAPGSVSARARGRKAESNSIGNQRELIRAFIHEQQDIELYDSYVDDGFSGSNFDRPEFKRMMGDIEAGRVNCVIVKDLSRFGRDYIESGRYIQKVFPALSVRFIALTDHYDSFRADAGESGIVLPVKNFINDSYCRDISTKVKSQFEVKRKNGEYISSFAPYGYQKAECNKNQLVIDSYAAEIVRKIFLWKIEGMASAAIAKKLNELGILSPKEYKKSIGLNFNGGFSGIGKAKWSSVAVKRILTNEVYLGHLVQGKTEKVNYKLKKSVEKPAAAWTKVENTHEAVISEDCFEIVQNLLQVDGRSCSDQQENNFFAGLLFCGDCKEQMVRRINWYNGIRKVFYICSTKNRGEGCSRHGISEEELKSLVMEMIRHYANCFLDEKRVFEEAVGMEVDFESVVCCNTEIVRLKEEKKKYEALCLGLHEDLRRGVVTKEEFERLYREFESKAATLEEAEKKQTELVGEMFRNGVISAGILKTMQTCPELKEIDRYTLCSMVKRIYVFEGKRIEIEFYYADSYRIMLEANRKLKDKKKRIGRSA
ncbi:MAG: recombinase family protein [Lachnospiraceae bacterium]|nr:recombinase family protein [Lachnospiraceae bacterium]